MHQCYMGKLKKKEKDMIKLFAESMLGKIWEVNAKFELTKFIYNILAFTVSTTFSTTNPQFF